MHYIACSIVHMADLRVAKPTPRAGNEAAADIGRADAFANAVGRLLRSARAKRGMTRRQLAEQSGASERYLAQIEGGQGNPSVIVLKTIAEALDLSIVDLLPRTDGRSETLERIVDVLRRMPQSELPAIADLIEGRAALVTDRARRIALVGLRGAGKSTLGERLAEAMDAPFIELNRMVE